MAATGIPVGLGIGTAAHFANRSEPSIRVIGDRDGMLILLETDLERVLVLPGDVDEWLWRQRSNLLTVGRSRIDAIIATYATLTTVGMPALDARDTTTILSLQRNSSLPPLRGNVIPVSDVMELRLGKSALLRIDVIAALNGDGAPDFLITFEVEDTISVIASSSAVIRRATVSGVHALIVPGEINTEDIAGVHPSLLVTSATDLIPGPQRQVITYTDSTAELILRDGVIHANPDQVLS